MPQIDPLLIIQIFVGGVISLTVAVIASIPGVLALILGARKRSIDEAELTQKVYASAVAPLENRIQGLEFERTIDRQRILHRDNVIIELQTMFATVLGGFTILTDQLNELKVVPRFQLNDEILDKLKKYISKTEETK